MGGTPEGPAQRSRGWGPAGTEGGGVYPEGVCPRALRAGDGTGRGGRRARRPGPQALGRGPCALGRRPVPDDLLLDLLVLSVGAPAVCLHLGLAAVRHPPPKGGALEGKGPQRRPQRR